MRHRTLVTVLMLQLYAMLLAGVHFFEGLKTDEAKYLLNIPYPHPPFARSILSATEWVPMHEWWWRCIFATLLVQAVWLFVRCVPTDRMRARMVVLVMYLMSSALVMQAGTIMMAPLSALFGAFFVTEILRTPSSNGKDSLRACGYGAVWFLSLFTAYQGILFAPIVFASLVRLKISRVARLTYFFVPLFLLALYTLSNPLAAASILNLGLEGSGPSARDMLDDTLALWLLSGCIIAPLLGIVGIWKSRSWSMLLTLSLMLLYSTLSFHEYYAILFLPLSVGGTVALLKQRAREGSLLLSDRVLFPLAIIGLVVALAVSGRLFVSRFHTDVTAKNTLHIIIDTYSSADTSRENICMVGHFGHEWQYASRVPIVKYTEAAKASCRFVICTLERDCVLPAGMREIGRFRRATVYSATRK